MKRKNILLKICYIAIFSALCFAGTSISFPVGASKVHLGNFFCILCGLLCGGIIGGLSGSIGMTLNDIVFGYPYTSFLRTMVTKFLMGFLVGSLFRMMIKKKINGKIFVWISALLMSLLFSYMLTMYCLNKPNYTIDKMILSAILFGLILINAIFSFKLSNISNCLSFSMIIGISVNVIGEFYIRIFFDMMLGNTYDVALATSISKLPGSLLTSIVTIILVMLLFYPVYKATHKINQFNDLEKEIDIDKK